MDFIRLQFQRAFKRLVVRNGYLSRLLPRDEGKFVGLQNESILSSILFVDNSIQAIRHKHANDYHEFLSKEITSFKNILSKFSSLPDFNSISREFRVEISYADQSRIEKAAKAKRKFNQSRSHDSYLNSQVPNFQSLVSHIEEDGYGYVTSVSRHYDLHRSESKSYYNKRSSFSGRYDNNSLYVEDDSDMEMDSDYESSYRRS
ncbi:13847_t:CDS:1, partial [Acaulospora colombiana]